MIPVVTKNCYLCQREFDKPFYGADGLAIDEISCPSCIAACQHKRATPYRDRERWNYLTQQWVMVPLSACRWCLVDMRPPTFSNVFADLASFR